jgi:hypothetical protein
MGSYALTRGGCRDGTGVSLTGGVVLILLSPGLTV